MAQNTPQPPLFFGDSRLPDRFWRKVKWLPNLCWEWTGAIGGGGGTGYGQTWWEGRVVLAHRVSYQVFIGPLHVGLEIDHLCRNSRCVNPLHLEEVTHVENVRRGEAGLISGRVHGAKTHCPQGHPYDEVNTYRHKRGRMCKECMRARVRARRAAGKR